MERIAVTVAKMHSGGKKSLVMEYYRHIDRSKIQFDFICDSDSNAIPYEEIEALGGRVFLVPPYQKIFKNMRATRKICKENNYRIMHTYNGTMGIFSMFVGWQCKIPIRIIESISMAHKSDKKTILKNLLRPISTWFATHYMANGVECGKWQFGNKLFEQGKIAVFKTVINTELNDYNREVREATRKEFKIEEKIVIGHIGRLTEQKNTLFLIDIFNEIAKKEPKAVLLVIGDGNLREEMLEKIERYGIRDKVLYLGRREDIQKFYCAMDAFLLPSLYEGLPVSGVEAQCCGLPVFFSTEVPEESRVCSDLGHFISLNEDAEGWADDVLKYTKANIQSRRGRVGELKKSGFDSGVEAEKLLNYYLGEIK